MNQNVRTARTMGYLVLRAIITLAVAFLIACGAVLAPKDAIAGPSSEGYTWPLPNAYTISQPYGSNGHTGTDISAPAGTKVMAAMDGRVKYVQRWDGHTKTGMQSYGNLVIVYHPSKGTATYYAHLSSISVNQGQSVSQGQQIGTVGTTGNSTGNHLHFEFRKNAKSANGTYGSGDGTKDNPLNHVNGSNIYSPHTHNYSTVVSYSSVDSSTHKVNKKCSCGATTTVQENHVFTWKESQYYCTKCGFKVKPAATGTPVTDIPENTTFAIASKLNTNFVFDVPKGSKEYGTPIELYHYLGGTNQQFTFIKRDDGTYTIKGVDSGKIIDVKGDATVDTESKEIIQYTYDSSRDTLRWYVERNSDGTYSFRYKLTNMYLDVYKAEVKDGGKLISYKSLDGDNQKFILYTVDSKGNRSLFVPPVDISSAAVSGVSDSYSYTGSQIKPTPTVKVGSSTLQAGVDYTVSYGANKDASSTGTVTITGKGKYTGTKSVSFKIGAAPKPSTPSTPTTPDSNKKPDAPASNPPAATAPTLSQQAKSLQGRFADLASGAWYLGADGAFKDGTLYLAYAVDKGLLKGYSGTSSFGPDDKLTRAQVAAILYRYANPNSTDSTTGPFATANTSGLSDVKAGQYYTAAVNWCVKNGIINGYGDKTFQPDRAVSRQELAKMVGCFCMEYKKLGSAGVDVSAFRDAGSIDDWAREGVAFCFAKGIVKGVGDTGNFDPKATATRAQMAKIIAVTVHDVVK